MSDHTALSQAGWLALVVLAACWFALWLRRRLVSRRVRRRHTIARWGEQRAEQLLATHGYSVVARQKRASYAIDVDGECRPVELILDLVVERDGRQLVAEVKTGHAAPRIEHIGTRRQLLEYQLATGCPRVLLVDPEAQTIREVSFPLGFARAQATRRVVRWVVLAVVLAIAALGIAQLWIVRHGIAGG